MTTLKDAGYLETDDPEVAACFLGRLVRMTWRGEPASHAEELCGVGQTGVYASDVDEYDYPILIPAKVVSDRFNGGSVAGTDRQIWYMIEAILTGDGPSVSLDRWLAKHADPGA